MATADGLGISVAVDKLHAQTSDGAFIGAALN